MPGNLGQRGGSMKMNVDGEEIKQMMRPTARPTSTISARLAQNTQKRHRHIQHAKCVGPTERGERALSHSRIRRVFANRIAGGRRAFGERTHSRSCAPPPAPPIFVKFPSCPAAKSRLDVP